MKLSKKEQNAKALAEYAAKPYAVFPINIAVEFKRLSDGFCPVVYWGAHESPCAEARGGNCDKESSAMNDALQYLIPGLDASGEGMQSLAQKAAKLGWSLRQTGHGPSFNCYALEPLAPAEESDEQLLAEFGRLVDVEVARNPDASSKEIVNRIAKGSRE